MVASWRPESMAEERLLVEFSVASEPGQGTTFTIELPTVEADESAP